MASSTTDWFFTGRPQFGLAIGHSIVYGTGGMALTNRIYEAEVTDAVMTVHGNDGINEIRAVGTAGRALNISPSRSARLVPLPRLRGNFRYGREYGGTFAVAGILISLAPLTRLQARQAFLMAVTALMAIANWLWARRRALEADRAVAPATALR